MTKKENNKIERIPISSIALGLFGLLLFIFSCINWFPSDLIRFFIGISGGVLVGFLGYFIWYDRQKSIYVDGEFTKIFNKIADLEIDLKTTLTQLTKLENQLIELKNA